MELDNKQIREQRFFNAIALANKDISDNLSQWDLYALKLLGDIKNKNVMEIGCGTGILTLELCKSGAKVMAIDLAEQAISIAKNRIKVAGFENSVKFFREPFENISLLDQPLDFVFGKWVLHHLNFKEAINKIYHSLEQNGKAVFIETSYLNPLLKFTREYLIRKFGIRKIGTYDEKPIDYKEIEYTRKVFKNVKLHFAEFSLFWLIDRHILHYQKMKKNR